MASISKTNRNTWRARVYLSDEKKQLTKTFHSSRDAKSWANEMENKRNSSALTAESNEPLVTYILEWYRTFKEPKVAPATARRYEATFNVLKRYWGQRELTSITFEDYQEFINKLAKTHSIASVQKIHSQTRAAVRKAVQTRKLSIDFTEGTELSGLDPKPAEQKYLEVNDMKKLLGYTLHNVDEIGNTANAMIATSLLTGMRYEEVIGLTWSNVDFVNDWIHVKQAYSQIDQEFIPTKNKSSVRNIKMTPSLAKMLKNWQLTVSSFIDAHGYANPHDFVYFSRQRNILSTNRVNAALRKLCTQLKLSKTITFHGLRHTHASYLLDSGSSIQYVSKRLGHQNTVVTQQIYAHLLEHTKVEEENNATDQLEKL